MRGINPRQMKQAMKKMGITNEEIKDVIEVIIRTPTKDIVIQDATVNIMTVQGQKTYQVDGVTIERAPGAETEVQKYSDEDIQIVMDQTGCDRERAIAGLDSANGDLAEAILSIMQG